MKRRELIQGGTLVLLLGALQIARGATILAVRVWPAAEYSRVTIESDAPLFVHQQLIENPPSLAVDIGGVELNASLRELVAKIKADDPFIAGIHVSPSSTTSASRLIIDLKQPVAPQVFNLAPVAAYKHRLVFDFYPKQEVDPLLAVLAEAGKSKALGEVQQDEGLPWEKRKPVATAPLSQPKPSSGDALGDLIASRQKRDAGGVIASPFGNSKGSAQVQLSKSDKMVVIALDPGHGGEDPGAIGGSGLREKDVVLQIAHRLRGRINDTVIQTRQGRMVMRVMMTREADYFVPLNMRVQKARRVQADLFVSIHADAFINPQAKGASVFALSSRGASSSAARWLAEHENLADLVGGFNVDRKDREVRKVLLDMSTTAQINDSLKLGSAMLGEIGHVGKLHKGTVEQAGFAVLKSPDIPSVLVETAFISNPDEEALLRTDAYQEQLADAVMRGIQRYFARNPPMARIRQA